MCFTVSVNIVREELEQRYGAELIDPDKYRPSYYYHAQSIPQMPVVCCGNDSLIDLASWGLIPSWIANEDDAESIRRKTFNARAESLSEKPSYSAALESGRCIIPVTGFFEWQHQGNRKIPWYITISGEVIFSLAGLYERWISPGGVTVKTFSVITVEANSIMAEIHNTKKRMPAILPRELEKIWLKPVLKPADAKNLLSPLPSEMIQAHTVSPLASDNSSDRNVPQVIQPYSYPVQGSLF